MDWSLEQLNIAKTILNVGRELGATTKQVIAAFRAAWVESRFRNLTYGDRDSLGVFQQRPSQGWGTRAQILNPEYAARKFFEAARTVDQSGTPGQLAQRVQRSAFPRRYDEQAAAPDSLLTQLFGGAIDLGSLTNPTMTGPYPGVLDSARSWLFDSWFLQKSPEGASDDRFRPFLGVRTVTASQRFQIAAFIGLIVIFFAYREL